MRRKVREVMTSPVATAMPGTTLAELAELMLERRVGSVVIVDPDDAERIVGIVTETDFDVSDDPIPFTYFRSPHVFERSIWSETSLEEAYAERRTKPASSIMSTPVLTVSDDVELWEAVTTMLKNEVKHLPVVRDDRLVGVVSRHDLLKCIAEAASAEPSRPPRPAPGDAELFDRIVCGVDGSPGSLESLAQALRLLSDGGRLVVATIRDTGVTAQTGFLAGHASAKLDEDVAAALEAAQEVVGDAPGVETRVIDGRPLNVMLELAASEEADLLSVGPQGHSRAAGLVLGSMTTTLLRDAPCSVLVARKPPWNGGFPQSLVVGFDGSPLSRQALTVASAIARRFDTPLRVLAATGGKPLDEQLLEDVPELEEDGRKPADALVSVSEQADLVVVGGRGLHGVRALGSVSEAIAHGAACSVLVVRRPEREDGE